MKHSKRLGRAALLASVLACAQHPVMARVSAEQAAQLGRTLTPLGGEMAGNKEGTIPAWTGGYKGPVPAPGSLRPDPFAAEKPSLVITASNASSYASKLPQGVMELFKHYPQTFKLEVFPTHRTASAPQFVYDNTRANATRAETANGGITIKGAYGGTPFPIPANGVEVMWNKLLYWRGISIEDPGSAYIGTESGRIVQSAIVTGFDEFPYYDPKGSVNTFKGVYWTQYSGITAPAYQSGNADLVKYTTDPVEDGTPGWQYLPGQRRVRKSPNLAYDMPNFFLSGLGQFDEIYGFGGALDRYDWKLVGKQEMYIPYNTNKFWLVSVAEQMKPGHHYNPDVVRWELHRVWVVDATLAPGKRNVVARRRLFLDEDTWQAVGVDEWDASGTYWRFIQTLPILMADLPAVAGITFPTYDFKRGYWGLADDVYDTLRPQWKPIPMHSDYFSPDNMASTGVQ